MRALLSSLALLAIAIAAFSLQAQQSANMAVAHNGAVEAGDTVIFVVTLDKAASVNVSSLSVSVGPEKSDPDTPGAGNSAGPANPEKTVFKIPVTVPVTAHSGMWHVASLTLNLASANKALKFNPTSFEVSERPLALPDAATIEIAK